jgi:hypothetical protein
MSSQSKLVVASKTNDSFTLNGAVTHSSSLDKLVDMFFLAGASRKMSEADIIKVFIAARVEDKNLAYKCLFWSRDIRGGAGERRFFQIIMKYVRANYSKDWKQLYQHIPTFGYWKDLLMQTPDQELIEFVISRLREDGLLCKWMPRHGDWFRSVRRVMAIPPKDLRGILVRSTKVVEQQMCANKWDQINYSHVPSLAFNLYKKAFERHDTRRFGMFLADAVEGKEKVNAGAIFPYQLYQSFKKGENANSIIGQWNNLPNYVGEGSFLPICDVSRSMTGMPMDISVSLGVYLSERNKSIFKDAFITFSTRPVMQYLKGNVVERFHQLEKAQWNMTTNLQAAFALILGAATKNNLAPEDLPSTVIIISDMEFNACVNGGNNMDGIRHQYKAAGYTLPNVTFWNVNGRVGNVPAQASDKGVALVSGASPAIVKSVLSGADFSPRGIMLQALTAERYSAINVE